MIRDGMRPQRTGSDPTIGTACPGRDRIARFVEGTLSPDDEDSLRGHTDVCATCRRLVADIGAGTGSVPFIAEPPKTREAEREGVIGPGALVGGKYRIARLIGTGGMGKVFAAVHVDLGHTLAIKVMHPEMARDADSVKRFLREGRAAALLKSDHAARINDVGRLPSGVPFLVMEYLEGEDLDRRRKRGPMQVEEVVDYMLQALAAITEAHGAGLVHRDIKPQNLFLAQLPDGRVRVKVLDFGLAKELPTLNRSNSALTTDNMILGSPHFMSPEQIRNPMNVDGRTDIWAVGATMFMLLAGQAPFTSNTIHGLLARILSDPAPRASDVRTDIPPALDIIIDRCMAKEVTARFQTVTELTAALREVFPGDASLAATRAGAVPATIQEAPPFTVADESAGEHFGATRVQPMSSAAIPPTIVETRPEQALPPTLVVAGGLPATLPLGVQSPGVPRTAPMTAAVVAPAHTKTAQSPVAPQEVRRAVPTLQSESVRPASPVSIPPEEPLARGAPPPPRKIVTSQRVAALALVMVSLGAAGVGFAAIRTWRAPHESTPAAFGSAAPAPAPPSSSSVAVPPSAPAAPSVSAAPSVAAAPSVSAAPPVSTALGAPQTSNTAPIPTAKKPQRPPPSGAAAAATATKDPYSWGH
jgi:serine/threonine-protein kinase